MKKNRFLNIIKWSWLVLVFLAAGYYFVKHHEMVTALIDKISIVQFLVSLLFLLIAKLLIGEITRLSVATEGWHPSYFKILGIYSVTSLGKYIPGGIWHFVGRFSTYRLNNLTNKQSTKAMIVENVWLISSSIAAGCIFYSLFQFETVSKYLHIPYNGLSSYLTAALIALLWVIGLTLFNRFFCTQNKNYLALTAEMIIISFCAWILIGISFISIFDDISYRLAGLSIGGYALSWAVGYIAVFAPGGIGVRESVLAAVFSVIAPAEQIAVYAAMNRIIWVIAEVFLGLIFSLKEKDLFKRKEIAAAHTAIPDPNSDTASQTKPE